MSYLRLNSFLIFWMLFLKGTQHQKKFSRKTDARVQQFCENVRVENFAGSNNFAKALLLNKRCSERPPMFFIFSFYREFWQNLKFLSNIKIFFSFFSGVSVKISGKRTNIFKNFYRFKKFGKNAKKSRELVEKSNKNSQNLKRKKVDIRIFFIGQKFEIFQNSW